MSRYPDFPADRITIVAWIDEPLHPITHDPRARYVETYWLSLLGPSATWLLRRIADELEASPSGFVMDVAETAHSLGLSRLGKNSAFVRSLGRLVQFQLARPVAPDVLAVRRHVPSLSSHHVARLTPTQQQRHEFWLKKRITEAS